MTVAQVGAWSGGASLIGGIAGLLTGGYAAGKLVKRDPRWELWLPALAIGACAPLYALMFMAPNPWISLVAKAAGGYLGAIGSGVALAAIQSMAEPNRRATAASLVLFVSSLLGMGGAPYAIGLVSDLLAPTVGDDSLRYGLLLTCVVLVWSVFHFVISARHGRQAQAQAEVAAAAV
jgi:MFS family permease